MLCCRGRITLHTRAGVEPDQLNFPLADYTDEEIPDSIEALQDAIKLDQVGAKLLSAFASVWLTARFLVTTLHYIASLQCSRLFHEKAAQKMLCCSLCITSTPQHHSPAAYMMCSCFCCGFGQGVCVKP